MIEVILRLPVCINITQIALTFVLHVSLFELKLKLFESVALTFNGR